MVLTRTNKMFKKHLHIPLVCEDDYPNVDPEISSEEIAIEDTCSKRHRHNEKDKEENN